MQIKVHYAITAILTASLSACATVPAGTYSFSQDAPINQTALIRPAKKEERQFKPSAAARILLSSAGTAQLLHVWPASDLSTGTSVRDYESVRVPEGSYLVKTLCNYGGMYFAFDRPIETKAGKEYLVECTGNNPAGAGVAVTEMTSGE